MDISIQNCNNIKKGILKIEETKLNIFFGRNGSGKSTVAKAINLITEGNSLNSLIPYGLPLSDKVPSPKIDGMENKKVLIFNDDYVKQIVFQSDSLISNAFDILIRSEEYDKAKKTVDDDLESLKKSITQNKEIIELQNQIRNLLNTLKSTSTNKLSKRGGTKAILEGKGAYFNPPKELDAFQSFFEEEIVSSWANWRLQGYDKYGTKGCCPYCSTIDSDKTETINKVFKENFDKSSVETAAKIKNALELLYLYIDENKIKLIISLFGTKSDKSLLELHLNKLREESVYLNNKLDNILSFNGMSVTRENIGKLENYLTEMKINIAGCAEYFNTKFAENKYKIINDEIKELIEKVGKLKGEIGKYNAYLQNQVTLRTDDINEFLDIAGFRYVLEVLIDSEDNAKAILRYILPNNKVGEVKTSGTQLSWGEKHSFALILFMFDAIRSNSSIIILDDPISSFDRNKKYAIMNRLFMTGNKNNSLYQRTVLMFTHDFEPIIDYIQTNTGRQDSKSICASYFENIKGELKISKIEKNTDLMSSIVLLKELSMDDNIDIAARIGCLRKYIEHQYRIPKKESTAYNILSSLVHNRQNPTEDNEGKILFSKEEIEDGLKYIELFIPNFDYKTILNNNSPKDLYSRYITEQSSYIKMLMIRYYIEQDENARVRLRIQNDVLRKYVDETYHIENDYLYSLDTRKFNIVPQKFIEGSDIFVKSEINYNKKS